MKVITYSSNKGGVGKSSIALNVAGYIGLKDKVLFIGLDGQKNSSSVLKKDKIENTIYDVLTSAVPIHSAIYPSKFKNVFYIPESRKLDNTKIGNLIIKKLLQNIYNEYDYVIIDCPPALNSLVQSAYIASDVVCIPTQLDKFSSQNLNTVIELINSLNNKAQIYVLPSMVVSNSKLHKKVKKELESFIDNKTNVNLSYDLPHRVEISNQMANDKLLTLTNKFNQLKTAIKKHSNEVR
ncbi:AAA family ATPase [Staphylococcus pseudintermedius]|uniref:ParA family protein n=1 Tax=Staphylococcus pseudintermedius TaxID=283734 RepID=UPI0018F4F1EC|nr:AAA family ATPase [Staphylococcus pseudintermedius]EGQ3068520.1 AAA family ATPase [Staphylococcus pseudintermedius]EGQ3151795.1 AAA family ATPase [Staphylococcus pseudintermedius]EGQ3871486.1 AAA family ATPase [Staphylococcus pseudintermedius]EHT6215648.1 AAA family ATPase [Staphylococcus pseudintermedius]EJH4195166.1 AAA family ATPase [Staphylococcus pseudintermedius]